jgi:hypothetical protein
MGPTMINIHSNRYVNFGVFISTKVHIREEKKCGFQKSGIIFESFPTQEKIYKVIKQFSIIPASPKSMKKRNTGPFLSLLVTIANIFLSHSGVLASKEYQSNIG